MIERRERQPRDWDRFDDVACDFVYGIAPVLAALRRRNRERFFALYVEEGFLERKKPRTKKETSRASWILEEAEDLEVIEVPKGQLSEAPGLRDATHQGVALCCSTVAPEIIATLPDAENGTVWLALDEVQDPRNLGALLRCARFLGAHGVVVSAKNSAPLSPVASKASAGALEEMASRDIYGVRNLPKVLHEAKTRNWRVVAAAVDRRSAVPLASFQPVGPKAPPTVVVVGSEGTGLRKLVLDAADSKVMVPPFLAAPPPPPTTTKAALEDDDLLPTRRPGRGNPSDVDSLNVAVTGGLLLYHFLPHHHHDQEDHTAPAEPTTGNDQEEDDGGTASD